MSVNKRVAAADVTRHGTASLDGTGQVQLSLGSLLVVRNNDELSDVLRQAGLAALQGN